MKFKCLGSGSKGNCYVLASNEHSLMLDCGIPWKAILKGIDYDVMSIDGCVISHEHSDHALSRKDVLKNGISVCAPYINRGQKKVYNFYDRWKVHPFEVPHDGTPCFGFLIEADEKVLYLTDFEYCKYTFKKQEIKTIIIECNHMDETEPNEEADNFSHVVFGHSSLSTVCNFLKENQTPVLRNVILVHLSATNADKKKMIEAVKEIVGEEVNVYAMTEPTEIEL